MASYNAATNVNMVPAQLLDIILYKFGRKDKISIMPQMMEFNLFPSLFGPVLQAELVINDSISLHTNYPLVGEEIIEVSYRHTADDINDPRSSTTGPVQPQSAQSIQTLTFNVARVAQVYPDNKTRASIYSISMFSPEYHENNKNNIMRAYRQEYHKIIPSILSDYLKSDPKKINTDNFEESKGIITTVVPNLMPLQCISWLCKRAVPSNQGHYNYLFYETLQGFNFKTLQKLIEDGKKVDPKKSFIYFSNALKDQSLSNYEQTSIIQSTITAINFEKRYSTEEKTIAGYYENEYFEIDLFNMRVNSTPSQPIGVLSGRLANNQINTSDYISAQQNQGASPGTRTRVRYRIGHGGGDQPNQENYWKDKFCEGVRAITALSQIQLVITVPGDTRVNPGDVVNLELPEFHGFNNTQNDSYISGDYIIVEMKHTISVGMKHVMVLKVARDSYNKQIATNHVYNMNVT